MGRGREEYVGRLVRLDGRSVVVSLDGSEGVFGVGFLSLESGAVGC